MLHVSIILLVALLYGAPYAKDIKSNSEAQVVNSWRVAHQSPTIGALVLFAAASLMAGLAVTEVMKWAIALPLIISGYAFLLSTPLAAVTKDWGLQSGAQGLARLVYLGNMLGVAGYLMGSALLAFAALSSL